MTASAGGVPVVQRWVRRFAASSMGGRLFAKVLHRADRATFAVTGGRGTVTSLVAGLPVIMLSTRGARTGRRHTVPVLGFPITEGLAIVAGNFGRRQEPAWCLNLRHDPRAVVVRDGTASAVLAEELSGTARQMIWEQCLMIYPGGAAYARRAAPRTIGVFLLHPDID